MEQNMVSQIHIIPFDLGCVFFDCLSIDNSKNLCFAEYFVDKLSLECANIGVSIEKNFQLKKLGKTITGIKYNDNPIAEQAICIAHIQSNLKCYILSNGVGVFLLTDLDGKALNGTDKSILQYSKALIANYQKKISQSTILNRYEGDDVFVEEEKLMLQLREICWKIVAEGVSKRKISHIRKFSAAKTYKAEGLSYVLTAYIFKENELTQNELKHLMHSTIFGKVLDSKEWEHINETIQKSTCEENTITLKIGNRNTYYSWSAVAVEIHEDINSFDEIMNDMVLVALLKAELYVQSRWFVADNSMDNVNKNSNYSMETLQRLASLIEFSQAELESDISANMNTLYKKILNQVVITSEVKQLYKSVANQINTQKKIKEAQYQDKKRKNKLIVDLFLAVFSASSLYKTISDLVYGSFSWVNWLLFGAMSLVAVGTIIFNYKNK